MTDLLTLPPFDVGGYLRDPDNFVVGMVLEKSRDASDTHWRVQGVVSCEAVDQEGEQIIQKGVDCAPLLTNGYINWDHRDKEGPAYLIGEPLEVGVVPARQYAEQCGQSLEGAALWVKGELYQDKPLAKAVWDHLQGETGRRRRLGWSVQGRVLKRDELQPKKIVKSAIYHLAITHQPVNTYTFAELAKSMTTQSAQPVLLENLHSKRLTTTLYGPCKGTRCYKSNGGFYRREHGALEHLVNCLGDEPYEAVKTIGLLKQRGFRFV